MSNAASRMGRLAGKTTFIKAEVEAEFGQATPRRFDLEVAYVVLTDPLEVSNTVVAYLPI
jgi:hypothetical protein